MRVIPNSQKKYLKNKLGPLSSVSALPSCRHRVDHTRLWIVHISVGGHQTVRGEGAFRFEHIWSPKCIGQTKINQCIIIYYSVLGNVRGTPIKHLWLLVFLPKKEKTLYQMISNVNWLIEDNQIMWVPSPFLQDVKSCDELYMIFSYSLYQKKQMCVSFDLDCTYVSSSSRKWYFLWLKWAWRFMYEIVFFVKKKYMFEMSCMVHHKILPYFLEMKCIITFQLYC